MMSSSSDFIFKGEEQNHRVHIRGEVKRRSFVRHELIAPLMYVQVRIHVLCHRKTNAYDQTGLDS
jgi:hypothetical protein